MTRIYCTKKLETFIGDVDLQLSSKIIYRSLSDWNAHLFYIERKNCLVFVNNRTAYTVFLIDIKKKDLKNINYLFYNRLIQQFRHDRINNEEISFEKSVPIVTFEFYKTNNDRKTIGRLNDFVDNFKANLYYKYGELKNMDIVYENGLINTTPTGKPGESKKTWSSPIENLRNELKPTHNSK